MLTWWWRIRLSSSVPEVRARAALRLGAYRDAAVAPLLLSALQDRDACVRRSARRALRGLGAVAVAAPARGLSLGVPAALPAAA